MHFLVVSVNVLLTDLFSNFVQELSDPGPRQNQSHLEDAELEKAVSLSLKVCCTLVCSDNVFL